jgi:pSer/pThr/pTyr-binding forkhead associated (FHA) protein
MVSGLLDSDLNGQSGAGGANARRGQSVTGENKAVEQTPKLLACLVNLDKGKIHTLTEEELSIGRSTSCDILINTDATVSRRHALVKMIGTEFYLEDLGSRNGTSVNGELVKGTKIKLNPDDQIHIGKTVYVFSPVGISEALYGSPLKDLPPSEPRKGLSGLVESVVSTALKLPRAFSSTDDTIQAKAVPKRK